MPGSMGGGGGGGVRNRGPEKTHKNVSNTNPHPLKITKLPSQHSMLGPMMARLKWYLDPPSPTLTKLSGSTHVMSL